MAIYQTENVRINGSQRFLGGIVYNLQFNQGFNGQHSTVQASIISENGQYQIPDLNFVTPYNIEIGGNGGSIPVAYKLKFFAYKYCITDGPGGRILTVDFRDGIDKLSRYLIAITGTVCTHPNVIQVGKLPTDDVKNKIISYNYKEFQEATAFLGIPIITFNEYVRLNEQGTVLDVFNRFMSIYGYSWYMENGTIKLIDLKIPIDITSTVNDLEVHPRKVTSTICKDISNNFTKGAIALDEDQEGASILNPAFALWDGTDINPVKFFDSIFTGGHGPKAALYALQGQEVYFAFIWKTKGLRAAVESFGLKIHEEFLLFNQSNLLNVLTNGDIPVYTSNESKNIRIFVCSENQTDPETAFSKDLALGNLLQGGYYYIQDINPNVSWIGANSTQLDSTLAVRDISEFRGLTIDNETVGNKTTRNVWLLTFPRTIIKGLNPEDNDPFFINVPFNSSQKEGFNEIFFRESPYQIPESLGNYQSDKYRLFQVNEINSELILSSIPDIKYPYASIRYVGGNLDTSQDIRFGVPSYGLNGRVIKGCIIPDVSSSSSSLQLETFENLTLESIDVNAYLQQIVYARDFIDTEYSCEIRGINTQLTITPTEGLDSLSIRIDGENGYITTYQLSSKRSQPPTIESLRKPKQKDTLN
jgi:hypothetical protein